MELSKLQYNSVEAMEIKRAERTGTEPRPIEDLLVDIFRTNIQNEADDNGYKIVTPIEDINPNMEWREVLPAKDRVPAVKNFFLEATYETDEEEDTEGA